MASRRPVGKKKALTRGARASDTKAARLRRERRAIGTNPNYQYWIVGYAERDAQKTGVLKSPYSVRRDPNFQRWVNVVLAHDPKRKHGGNSQLARALVELGIRDPSFRGAVGNSPKASARGRPRDVGRARRGISRSTHQRARNNP